MRLYEAFKEVLSIAQKADNIELYRQLLDLSAQVLDMQEAIAKLKKENSEFKVKKSIACKIVRHIEPVVTLKNDSMNLRYCSHCWDSQQLLVQLNCHEDGTFDCPHCKTKGNYDNAVKKQADAKMAKALQEMNSFRRRVSVFQ